MTNYIKEDKIEELGKDFVKELEDVLRIRAERKLIYGDSFQEESILNLLTIIDGKTNRFKAIQKLHNYHPKMLDEARDLVNYWLFVCCMLENKK